MEMSWTRSTSASWGSIHPLSGPRRQDFFPKTILVAYKSVFTHVQVQRVFREFDEDGSGSLDTEEIEAPVIVFLFPD